MLESGNRLAQTKLKILYILGSMNVPISNMELTRFVLEKNILDYFTLQEIIVELNKDSFIRKEFNQGKETYVATEEGSNTLEMFIHKIPISFREIVDASLHSLRKKTKRDQEIFSHYYQRKDQDFTVILQSIENTVTLFNLSLNVPTEDLAKKIAAKWKQHPEKIYSEIINILMR